MTHNHKEPGTLPPLPLAVIGLGAGGHAAVLIEVLRLCGCYDVIGLLDPRPECLGMYVLQVPVLGSDTVLPDLHQKGVTRFFVGVGSIGEARTRQFLFALGLRHEFEPVQVIHPAAIIAPSAKIGRGCAVLAGAIVNTRAEVGENVIINTGAIIEHDCVIGAHSHVATGARLAGSVVLGEGAHIGIGATIRQGIRIGASSIVGAGAVVVKDVPDQVTVVGVPAKAFK